jgi:hypothetical protein
VIDPLARSIRFAAAVLAVATIVVINIAAFTYPSIPRCRGEVVAELARIDPEAKVVMSASFDPLLQHVEHRRTHRFRDFDSRFRGRDLTRGWSPETEYKPPGRMAWQSPL